MAILQMTINVPVLSIRYGFSYYTPKGNWIVDWGDGCIEVNNTDHYYKEEGNYQVTIRGDFDIEGLRFPIYITNQKDLTLRNSVIP